MSDPSNEEELIEIEAPPDDVQDTPDGGALVVLGDAPERDEGFWANLAESMPEVELSTLASDLIQKIERDAEARKKRVEQYEEGLRRTGLGDDAPGGAQFNGASKAVHPIITEACIDFSARIMKEMMPFDGPVKDKILGEATDDKVQKAKRKSRFMNWQITEQMPEFRSEFEQMETQVPLGGSQYFSLYFDKEMGRPVPEFVPIDDVLLPFAASGFYSAHRKTRVLHLTQFEFERRVDAGIYRDLDLIPETQEPEATAAETANRKIEGKESTQYNEDGLRDIYECYTTIELEGDDRPLPYLIVIDKATMRLLAIYRNYQEDDERCQPIDHLFEFDFIRWRGSYGIGIPHIAGGLAGAITGAMRALLDSALINNMPTLLKLKGGSRGGESINLQPTEMMEVDGQLSPDQDIRKTMMAIPFNPPSPVLFELMGFLTTAAKGVVRTSLDNEAMDTNQNTPVGTQLSRVEQGLVVFSSIFMRQYTSMNRVLKRLHEINRDYLTEMNLPELDDEKFVEPQDFQGEIDIIPVANPTIYSEQQRLAQFTALQQRAALMPQLYKMDEIERAFVQDVLRMPNAEKYLNIPPEPERRTAAAENVAMMVGNDKVEVYPDQDDIAHIMAHIQFFQSPVLGGNPLVAMKATPALVPHLFKHFSALYTKGVNQMTPVIKAQMQMAHAANPGAPPFNMTDDQVEALAALQVEKTLAANKVIMQAMPILQQMSQQLQQNMPQDPMRLEMQKVQADAAAKAQKAQADAAKAQNDLKIAQMEAQAEAAKNAADNDVKQKQLMLDKMAMDLEGARQMRQEMAEQRQADRDWFEVQKTLANEERRAILEQQQAQNDERQRAFEQQMALSAQAFEQRIAALAVETDAAKQRLAEFVAGQTAQMDREQAALDRTALAHEIATSVAEVGNKPRQRTVKFKRGEDGNIESGEIHEGEG